MLLSAILDTEDWHHSLEFDNESLVDAYDQHFKRICCKVNTSLIQLNRGLISRKKLEKKAVKQQIYTAFQNYDMGSNHSFSNRGRFWKLSKIFTPPPIWTLLLRAVSKSIHFN